VILATTTDSVRRRRQTPAGRLLPLAGLATLVAVWEVALRLGGEHLLPSPAAVARALVELGASGLLLKHVVASLFRVTWGYLGAALVAVPSGLLLGWRRRGQQAVGPLLEVLRPISPLAWIPLAILWFGVGDLAAVFIIFLASFLPLAMAASHAVHNIPAVHLQAGRNFRLSPLDLARQVVVPAVLPQLLVALRLALGIAWLVVVAAEMIAVNSGLGFLIVDARNAGNRYDLVVAGMVMIGMVGLLLDLAMRRLERLPALRWGYAAEAR
jgi:NitT/TauT family transport system permease protein